MLLQYFLTISPVCCVLDRVNYMPDIWNIGGPRGPLQREDWRTAFENGFRSFCKNRRGVGNLTYEASWPLFQILEKHVNDKYADTNVFRGFYMRVGWGYNPLDYLKYYVEEFAKYISRHTYEGANYTCQIFREYPRFQCDTYSWGLSLYIYCIFVRK